MAAAPLIDVTKNLAVVRDYLAQNQPNSEMDLSCLQGFLYALATAPCFIMSSSWLMVVCGGVPSFASEAHQKSVLQAFLELAHYINKTLTTMTEATFLLWASDPRLQIALPESTDAQIAAFCGGYFRGFLLDPIRLGTLGTTHDELLLLCLALMKLAQQKQPQKLQAANYQLISNEMKSTLVYLVLHNYQHWDSIRTQGLIKSYLNQPLDGTAPAALKG